LTQPSPSYKSTGAAKSLRSALTSDKQRPTRLLQCCRSLSTAEDALRHATDLQKDGLRLCQEEFLTVLKGNLQEPNASRLAQASPAISGSPNAGELASVKMHSTAPPM